MTKIVRHNDTATGICYHPSHIVPFATTGKIIASSSTTHIEGKRVARVGDIVQATCGHTGTIVDNSVSFYAEGIKTAIVGDTTTGDFISTIDDRSGTSYTKG